METVKSIRQSILVNEWVSIDLTDAYLHVPIDPQSWKYLWFIYRQHVYQFTALPLGMSLGPWIFTKLMDVRAGHLRQRAFSLLDNLLIRGLIRNRPISHTICCRQTVQSLGFIPNLKKSDSIPEVFHVYRHGISDTTKYSQGTGRPNQFSYFDYQN